MMPPARKTPCSSYLRRSARVGKGRPSYPQRSSSELRILGALSFHAGNVGRGHAREVGR
jgi:hypothetical protein